MCSGEDFPFSSGAGLPQIMTDTAYVPEYNSMELHWKTRRQRAAHCRALPFTYALAQKTTTSSGGIKLFRFKNLLLLE